MAADASPPRLGGGGDLTETKRCSLRRPTEGDSEEEAANRPGPDREGTSASCGLPQAPVPGTANSRPPPPAPAWPGTARHGPAELSGNSFRAPGPFLAPARASPSRQRSGAPLEALVKQRPRRYAPWEMQSILGLAGGRRLAAESGSTWAGDPRNQANPRLTATVGHPSQTGGRRCGAPSWKNATQGAGECSWEPKLEALDQHIIPPNGPSGCPTVPQTQQPFQYMSQYYFQRRKSYRSNPWDPGNKVPQDM
ncbi:uncharacterized protein [Manis javanica]|uniref:uncharacterized protein n=1 Tax=Manis javanica TaxID=9974 RepID=UPI003C6DACAA